MDSYHGTLGTYVSGFIGSLACTLLAYYLVVTHGFSPALILGAVVGLVVFQFGLQLVLFLHLGRGKRWDVLAFLFAFLIVCIVVIGSLWIMTNLNGRMMMAPEQVNDYMDAQTGL